MYNSAAALLADENGFPGTDMARFGDSTSIILSRRTVGGVSLLAQMDEALGMFDEHYTHEEVESAPAGAAAAYTREAPARWSRGLSVPRAMSPSAKSR